MRKKSGDVKLIVNADDFGLTRGVNEGIIDAHELGILTSATLMTNMPAAEHAVSLAKYCPKLGVGVHVNLTSGRALCPLDDLSKLTDDDGRLPSLLQLVAKAWLPKTVVPIRREIKAQVARAIDAGVRVTHLDSHKHVFIHPVVLAAAMSVAKEFGIKAIRAPVEDKPLSKLVACSVSSPGRMKANVVSVMAKRARRILLSQGFCTTDWFLGIARTGDWDAPALATAILGLKSGISEIMVHPGKVDDELRSTHSRLIDSRGRELEILTSEGIRSTVEVSQVKLVSYDQLTQSIGKGDSDEPFF